MAERKPKRGQNQGSITQRADGTWHARITIPATGRRKSFYGKTRLEVETKMTAALADLGQGILPSARQSVAEYLAWWLEHVVKSNRRPSTYRFYEQQVRIHLIPGLGRIELGKLTAAQVDAFFAQQRRAGCSTATIDASRRTLRAALSKAVQKEQLQRNVVKLTEAPGSEHREMQVFDADGVRRFLDAVSGDPHEALYVLALTTGLRKSELLGLRWCDIDTVQRVLVVRGQLQYLDGRAQLVAPKTAQAYRVVPLPALAIEALNSHRERQERWRVAAGEHWRDTFGLVFTSKQGNPHNPRNVFTYFQRKLAKAGLPPMRFHDLRHSYASLLVTQGVDVRTLSELMGHSQITVTLSIYTHSTVARKHEAVRSLDTLLDAYANRTPTDGGDEPEVAEVSRNW